MRKGLVVWMLSICCALNVASAAQPAQPDYLPLMVGTRWVLTSRVSPTPMVFEVTDRRESVATVRWDNPWVKAEFGFVRRANQVLLATLDMGAGSAAMPANTVYFDFAGPQGTRWKNQLGEISVAERGATVLTPAGTYRDAIVISVVDPRGSRTVFTFAPNVGFVRFGEGRDAFLLQSVTRGSTTKPPSQSSQRGGTAGAGTVRVGIDFNPARTEGFSDAAKRKSFKTAVDAGLNFVYVSPKWNELEPSPGRYNFSQLDFMVGLAEEHNLPISVNFRVIDTGNSTVPAAYGGWKFDDPRLLERFENLLRAARDRMKGRVRWVTLGNEVNGYFDSRTGEIAAYAQLLRRAAPSIRENFPSSLVAVNFTSEAAGNLNQRYRAITEVMDFYSFTYYPLNADFTMRPPTSAGPDIRRLLDAAGPKPLVLQEVGYASSPRLKSSPQAQAAFFSNVFDAIREQRNRFLIVHVLFMSDLPDTVVEDLTKYYRMANSENFKAYLATLGLRDDTGKPKPAWEVFAREARRIAGGG